MIWVIYFIIALLLAYAVAMVALPWQTKRKIRHVATYLIGGIGTMLALIPLILLLYYLVKEGSGGLSLKFFTEVQKPLGEAGSGMKHAIIGTIIIVFFASAIGIPVGVLSGVYLAQFGRGRFAATIRFLAEVLTGLPSIIAGILAYSLLVVRFGYSAFAGSVALAVLMIPVITRVTEESIRLVPRTMVEASYGLGAGPLKTVWSVVLPAARAGILTGIVLAVARVGGETAPLLFTTAGQSLVNLNPTKAMAALPLSIYVNSNQPFPESIQLAITGALFLVVWIALINLFMRWLAIKTQPKLS